MDGDINFLTFAEYIPPAVVKNFEKKYGVKVHQSFYSTQPEMVTKMATGAPIDLVLGDSAPHPQLLAGKLIQPFDLNELKNANQLDGYFKAPWWDHGKYRYSVPYGAGPTGIMWRKDKVKKLTNRWGDIWSHPEANGHIYLLSQQGDTMGMALIKNGYSCNSGDPSQVGKATKSLLDLKPHVASFTTNLAPVIASGDAWLMEGWTTQIYQGLVQNKTPGERRLLRPAQRPAARLRHALGRRARQGPRDGPAVHGLDHALRQQLRARQVHASAHGLQGRRRRLREGDRQVPGLQLPEVDLQRQGQLEGQSDGRKARSLEPLLVAGHRLSPRPTYT